MEPGGCSLYNGFGLLCDNGSTSLRGEFIWLNKESVLSVQGFLGFKGFHGFYRGSTWPF